MGSGPQVALVEGAPDLLSLHRSHPGRYPFLLQSVDSQCASGRFDILFAFPGSTLALGRDGRVRFDGNATPGAGFLAALDETWRSLGAAKTSHHELPFRGGWFIYLGYELAAELESRLSLPRAPWPGLDACAVRIPAALIRDHAKRRTWAVCEAHNELVSARAAIATMREDVAAAEGSPSPALHALGPVREEPPQRFVGGIERIRRYIRAGDVFQVNLSRLWTVPVPAATHPADLYRRLRARNPAPFSGLAAPGRQCHPELLARTTGGGPGPDGANQAHCRHLSARAQRGGRRGPGPGAAATSQGTRRARDADRSRAQ